MFISKMALDRRTFLKGTGAALALPLLDAMSPAMAATATPAKRLSFVYVPNGMILEQWIPATTGPGFALPPIMKALEPVKSHLTVLSGLAHREADSKGDSVNDHPRASAVWLSGVHAWDRVAGVPVKLGITADQIAARALGTDTQVPSLELILEQPTQISCDSGDCFHANTISWRNETTPNFPEAHPRVVFEQLFGDGGSVTERAGQSRMKASILDSIRQEASRLRRTLGQRDSTKLSEYLDAVREVEQRIQSAERHNADTIDLPDRPTDVPATFEEHAKLMFDLQVLAFRADVTRVFSTIVARELSGRTYPNIGVPDQHHAVSHHRNDPALIAKKAKIDAYHVQLLGYFLEQLQRTSDGDGSLLDHSLIIYGGGIGDGNLHTHWNVPLLLAGGLGGAVKPGRHLAYSENTPMTNLLVTILDRVGAPTDKLGDSTGKLTQLDV